MGKGHLITTGAAGARSRRRDRRWSGHQRRRPEEHAVEAAALDVGVITVVRGHEPAMAPRAGAVGEAHADLHLGFVLRCRRLLRALIRHASALPLRVLAWYGRSIRPVNREPRPTATDQRGRGDSLAGASSGR